MNESLSNRRARNNMLFNFLGRGGSSLLLFIFIPLFIRLLGAESWGVVAFTISLAAIATAFDFGFGATLSRELARYSASADSECQRADTVRSLELPFLALSLLVMMTIAGAAGFLASQWLKADSIPVETLAQCLRLAAPVVGLQLLAGLYNGGLQGLQRQLLTNAARFTYTLVLYAGGFLVLKFSGQPSVASFIAWQLLCIAAYTLFLRYALYAPLRVGGVRPRWRKELLRDCYRFAAGMAGTGILVVCLTQLDKLLLSGLLGLEAFGLYMLAVSLTSLQVMMVQPVQLALFPQLTTLLSSGQSKAAGEKFLYWSRQISILIFPLGALLIVFSEEIARLWLQDADIAAAISLPISILAAGSLLNAVCTLPYTLQLSAGWSSLGFYANLISVFIMVPALLVLTPRYGQLAAAGVWFALNLGYVCLQVPVMFNRLLSDCRNTWFRVALVVPAIASFSILIFVRQIADHSAFDLWQSLTVAAIAALLAVFVCWRFASHSPMEEIH